MHQRKEHPMPNLHILNIKDIADYSDYVYRLPGATPEEFHQRHAELEASGFRFGRKLQEAVASPDPSRLVEQVFENGTLVETFNGIYLIRGAIRDRWVQLGGRNWGLPMNDETDAEVRGGRFNNFHLQAARRHPNAAIYWSRYTGAHEISGIIYNKFVALGGVKSIGFPTNGNAVTPNNNGSYVHFKRVLVDDAVSSIYYSRGDSEAFVVHGDIRRLWSSMGWELSALGYPTSDEFGSYKAPNPERRQYFAGGTMIWRPTTGSFIETQDYQIRFSGFRCIRGDDGVFDSNGVEYYFVVGAVPRVLPETASSTKLPLNNIEYEKMRPGRWRHADVVVYRGNSDSLVLTLTGAERDTGDPNKYLPIIEEATKKAAGAIITAVAGLAGGVGTAAGAAVGAPLGDLIGKEVGKIINDALDTGDEKLDPVGISLGVQAIRHYMSIPPFMAPARTAEGLPAAPIPYHFATRMRSSDNEVELFFEVRRGLP